MMESISGYFLSPIYWSWENYIFLAHLGDLTAIILLITSNNFSKEILGKWWKKIQKLSYVYFFSSALYLSLAFGDFVAGIGIIAVSFFVALAFFVNKNKK
jgi:DMSO/TMAO reductase YedYZ heme-binding membrane subunit